MAGSMEKWQAITQDPRVVHFFAGLFGRVGVHVLDTGELFTCIHHGNSISFEPTLDQGRVDYTVDIHSHQVDRLASQASAGELDEAEQFRILSALVTPATAATLKHPYMTNNLLRLLAGAEDLIHVHVKSPAPEDQDIKHTLIYVNRQWLVVPGLLGRARRTFELTPSDALAYQRRVFALIKSRDLKEWINFALWYRQWRQSVSG